MTLQQFETGSGYRIFRLEVNAFPDMPVNLYLILAGDYSVLIDTASGFNLANDEILAGLRQVERQQGNGFTLDNLTHIFLTHAHIDHFGGLPYLSERINAQIAVHELDRRILDAYEETLALTSKRLYRYLLEAGLPESTHSRLMDMYRINKTLFHSVPVDLTYGSQRMRIGPFEMLHVPGHTAGHVLIRIDQCVFTGDHILERVSPHQAPEGLTLSTGLEHYLASLDTARDWVAGARYIFPGHQSPIKRPIEVINQIQAVHEGRLNKVLEICEKPQTIAAISKYLFPHAHGYHELLALEETGAHVEYLYERGWLRLVNYADVEQEENSIPLFYQQIKLPTHFYTQKTIRIH